MTKVENFSRKIKKQEARKQMVFDSGDIRMPWGKHKGKKLSEVPLKYLEWILKENEERMKLFEEIEEEINRRNK